MRFLNRLCLLCYLLALLGFSRSKLSFALRRRSTASSLRNSHTTMHTVTRQCTRQRRVTGGTGNITARNATQRSLLHLCYSRLQQRNLWQYALRDVDLPLQLRELDLQDANLVLPLQELVHAQNVTLIQ